MLSWILKLWAIKQNFTTIRKDFLQFMPLVCRLHYAYMKLCYVHLRLSISSVLTGEVMLW